MQSTLQDIGFSLGRPTRRLIGVSPISLLCALMTPVASLSLESNATNTDQLNFADQARRIGEGIFLDPPRRICFRHNPTAQKVFPMKIDFVSDVACPWCAVGLNSLETALKRIGDEIPVTLHMQPFELNPDMGADGVDAAEYLSKKYGISGNNFKRTAPRFASAAPRSASLSVNALVSGIPSTPTACCIGPGCKAINAN